MSELGTKDKSKHFHTRMQMTQNKREPCFETLTLPATMYHVARETSKPDISCSSKEASISSKLLQFN